MVEHRLEELLLQKFLEPEFSECFLLNISINIRKKVEIILDADNGINLEKCQRISRFLERNIDENNWLGDDYSLEVSSPGVSRPLQLARQYPQHIGRTLEVTPTEGGVLEGKLITVTAENIVLEYEEVTKVGKKKVKEMKQQTFSFGQIKKAMVIVSFG
jgi:ribosome maturation factor RimP